VNVGDLATLSERRELCVVDDTLELPTRLDQRSKGQTSDVIYIGWRRSNVLSTGADDGNSALSNVTPSTRDMLFSINSFSEEEERAATCACDTICQYLWKWGSGWVSSGKLSSSHKELMISVIQKEYATDPARQIVIVID